MLSDLGLVLGFGFRVSWMSGLGFLRGLDKGLWVSWSLKEIQSLNNFWFRA